MRSSAGVYKVRGKWCRLAERRHRGRRGFPVCVPCRGDDNRPEPVGGLIFDLYVADPGNEREGAEAVAKTYLLRHGRQELPVDTLHREAVVGEGHDAEQRTVVGDGVFQQGVFPVDLFGVAAFGSGVLTLVKPARSFSSSRILRTSSRLPITWSRLWCENSTQRLVVAARS